MPLNTEIKGDPDSIRSTVEWLKARARDADDTARQVQGAQTTSESTWGGPAAEDFRSVMGDAVRRIDVDADDLTDTAGALDRHADDLHTVLSRMSQAREIAAEGGLRVDGYVIAEPGPELDPHPLSASSTMSQIHSHGSGTQAQSAQAAKMSAYLEASKVVTDASSTLNDSQSRLVKFLNGYAEKTPFNIAEISTGLAGAVAERTSNYRAMARGMDPAIERAAHYAKTWKANPYAQARADAREIERRLAKQDNLNKAVATRTARMVDKLPNKAKGVLQWNMSGKLADNANDIAHPLLRNGTKALGKLPVVGAGITGLGVGMDIAGGEDPGKAVASGASSYVAGSLTTAGIIAASGPVGWGVAAGAVVSAGVGFVVDEWGDDIASGLGTAADAVGDAGKAVGNFVSDLF